MNRLNRILLACVKHIERGRDCHKLEEDTECME